MATLRSNWKSAAVIRKTQEEHPRSGQSRNKSVHGINDENITQVFEQIKGKVTKKIPRNSAGQSPALRLLYQNQTNFSWTHRYWHKSEPFRNFPEHRRRKPGTKWDQSWKVSRPGVGSSVYRSHLSIDSDPDEAPHTGEPGATGGFANETNWFPKLISKLAWFWHTMRTELRRHNRASFQHSEPKFF